MTIRAWNWSRGLTVIRCITCRSGFRLWRLSSLSRRWRFGSVLVAPIISAFFLLGSILAQESSPSAQKSILVVGSEEDYPPFAIGKSDGQAVSRGF